MYSNIADKIAYRWDQLKNLLPDFWGAVEVVYNALIENPYMIFLILPILALILKIIKVIKSMINPF